MSTISRIAITPGEPAGIGPDISIALARHAFDAQLVFITDPDLINNRARQLGQTIEIVDWNGQSAAHQPGIMQILPVKLKTAAVSGQLNKDNAPFVLECLRIASDACLSKQLDALVTGPIQKSIINDAGISFSGHTEFLAQRCQRDLPVMMLATEDLRVALVTTHLPLINVPAQITQDRVEQVLEILHHDLRTKYGINSPRIIVCGLNPHAGEDGHLGTEEITAITPAIEKLKSQGMDLEGPLPADTLFTPHYLDDADAVLAMYHDQGLPVLKYAGFGNAINITLGLPIIRTSVDHGTALALAGTGKANTNSLILAVNTAIDIVNRQTL